MFKKLLIITAVLAAVVSPTLLISPTANAWTADHNNACDAGSTPDKWVQYVQEINPSFDPRANSFVLTQNGADTDYFFLYQAHQYEDDPGGYQTRIDYVASNYSIIAQPGGGSGTPMIDVYKIDGDGGAAYALGTLTTTTAPVTDVSCIAINNSDGWSDAHGAPDPEPDYQDYFEWLELQPSEARCVNENDRSKYDSHCTDAPVTNPPDNPPSTDDVTFIQKAAVALTFIISGFIVAAFRYRGYD